MTNFCFSFQKFLKRIKIYACECVRKKKERKARNKTIYDISEIDFINVVCLDGNVNRLFVSLSNGIPVVFVVNDDDVYCRERIGGSIKRDFVDDTFADVKSSNDDGLADI